MSANPRKRSASTVGSSSVAGASETAKRSKLKSSALTASQETERDGGQVVESSSSSWEEHYKGLLAFYQEYKSFSVPASYKYNDKRIDLWLAEQQALWQRSQQQPQLLTPQEQRHLERLEALGCTFPLPRPSSLLGKRVRTEAGVTTRNDNMKRPPRGPTSGGAEVAPAASMPVRSISTEFDLKTRFLETLALPQYATGISNAELKAYFRNDYPHLVPIINELNRESRLTMSHTGSELSYQLVSDSLVSKMSGLDVSARMVYQVIEKSRNNGIWTKDIRLQTNIQQQMLTKILKTLETRRLIKPVKSVTAKAKKLYMLYDLTPSKEITGGVWYSELEFDHSFIQELREFLLQCIRRLNGGKGASLAEIRDKIVQANVSRVQLGLDDLAQIVQTLVYDHLVDAIEDETSGTILYEVAKRLSSLCEFQWWDAVSDDFHFRAICFEDGITLAPHEPHYHTNS